MEADGFGLPVKDAMKSTGETRVAGVLCQVPIRSAAEYGGLGLLL